MWIQKGKEASQIVLIGRGMGCKVFMTKGSSLNFGVVIEKFVYKFFEEHRHKDFNYPRKLVLAYRNIPARL